MKKFFICFRAILAYWVLLFIGPALVIIFNNIGYFVSGGGWGPDSLMYKVLQILSQPIACFLAYGAITAILQQKHSVLKLVNCVIAACYCFAMIFVYLFFLSNVEMLIVMIASTIVCVITAVMAGKEINSN